ncbi:MFS transporter [Larkinella soli]|uniref:MFS transporter n=1 Tax=Larkinella soli TaxID=1770527 RepID=UPI0013E3E73B|nr:MFS transporter [Larkinella soli]
MPPVRNHLILFIACTGVFVEALDIAILNLALPLIQDDLKVDPATIPWLQTVYVLLYGSFLVIGGKLADTLGRRQIFLSGILLFLVASFGAGVSGSFWVLAVFRAVQGLAAALVMPAALSLITNTFTDPIARGKAIGIFSGFAAIGSGSGLSVGGLIATWLGWQWVFFINVPILLVLLGLTIRFIPADRPDRSPSVPDLPTALLLALTLLVLTYGVHALGDPNTPLGLLPVLVVLLAAGFLSIRYRLERHPHPLIHPSVLRPSAVRNGLGVTLLLGAVFTGYLLLISLLLQQHLHFSAARAGLLLFPFSLLSAGVARWLIPSLLRRFSVLQAGVLGMGLMALGSLALLSALPLDNPLPVLLLAAACIAGLGIAVCFTSLTVLVVSGVPAEHHGLASSLGTTAYFIGGGLGLSVLSLLIPSEGSGPTRLTGPVLSLLLFAGTGTCWLAVYQARKAARTKAFAKPPASPRFLYRQGQD